MITDPLHEPGEYLLSTYGTGYAIAGRGDPAFLSAFTALILNHQSDRGRARVLPYDDQTVYAMLGRDSFTALMQRFYHGLISLSPEVPRLPDGEWDELAIEAAATAKASTFIATRLKESNILSIQFAPSLADYIFSYRAMRKRTHSNSDENAA